MRHGRVKLSPHMKLRFLLTSILILALNFQTASASSSPLGGIRFTHLTIDQGLSESTIPAITQDERGFMWFGTQNGLDRYDGYTVEEFTSDTPLPSKNIRALLADGEQLWMGTWGGGLVRIDLPTGNFTVFSSTSAVPEQRPGSDFIRVIFRDAQGRLWIGGNAGLDVLNAAETTFTHYILPGTELQTVYAIAEDAQGNLWLGTDAGIFQLAADSSSIRNVMQTGGSPVTALWMDLKRNQLWAGTISGLYRLDPANGNASHFSHEPANPNSLGTDAIASLFSDQPDRLWVGTENGVDLLDLTAPVAFIHITHDDNDLSSLASGLVLSIFQDNLGGIWFSSWTSGLSYYHPARFKFPVATALPSFPVSFAHGENETLWVGTFEQGLLQLDKNYQIINTYQHQEDDPESLPNNTVMALAKDRQNRLWIGTLGGLCRLDTDKSLQYYPMVNKRVRSLLEDRQGNLWVGTMEGLFRIDGAGEITHYEHSTAAGSLSNNNVLSIFQDQSERLWFGTDDGLNRLETDLTFSQPVRLEKSSITVIHEDEASNLWLGTWGSGLAQIDAARQSVRYYTEDDGLANEVVLGILEDDAQHLWISTSRGLSRFDLGTASFRTFGLSDGLSDVDFAQGAFLQRPDGQLLFGSGAGITHFNPAELPTNTMPPAVVLTNFQIFNQDVHPGTDSPLNRKIEYTEHLTLRHDQSIFSFDFAALNYISPENSEYAYRMEGVDPDWNYTRERRFVTYTNLNPGEYTFRVRAANGDGVWNDNGVSLHVTILPPWWMTWWAYLFYGIATLGLVGGFTNWRSRRYREKIATQQKLLEQEHHLSSLLEQLDVIQEEDRRRIAHEMHDGLAQTLASLRLRSRVWHTFLKQSPDKLHAEFDNLAQVLDDSVQEVRRSIFALRPIALDEQGLFPALKMLAEEMGVRYGIEVQVKITCEDDNIHHSLEHPLFRVTQELLNNVGKHAHTTHASLTLTCDGQMLRLVVSDNGTGFDPNRPKTESTVPVERGGLGLRQMRERVEILGGSLHVKSDPGDGTRVSIELPLVK